MTPNDDEDLYHHHHNHNDEHFASKTICGKNTDSLFELILRRLSSQKSMFSKAQKKGLKKKWSLAEFLLTDSNNGPEKHGDVRFAEFLANTVGLNKS